jgi:hypothetical protein
VGLLKTINTLAQPSSKVPFILEQIEEVLPVEEMINSRGREFYSSGFYQIRIKPLAKDISRDEILENLNKHFTSIAKRFKLSDIKVNVLSRNSGKFGSLSFMLDGVDFDIVVARGGNGGELFENYLIERMNKIISKQNAGYDFERKLISIMDKHVAGIESNKQAEEALRALRKCNPIFKIKNINYIVPRSGSTRRNNDLDSNSGEVIGDMVIVLKNGKKEFVSIKSFAGKSVSQFGISKAFNDDLTVNTKSSEWLFWLQPFGIDPKKVEEGLRASQTQNDLSWEDIEHPNLKVTKSSKIYQIFEKLWGIGYYYLKEMKSGFHAFKVDKTFIDDILLKNLKITEIRYPSKNRKQISIYAESKSMKFKIEIRNPRGRGSSRLTQIQLAITKNSL